MPALAHGCNTLGAMGAGIAREFRRRYPAMYDEYRRRCGEGSFGLGDVLTWWEDPTQPVIFNLATQPRRGRCASLGAIRVAVSEMLDQAEHLIHVDAIGMPQIGCGLGGLRWMNVRPMLDEVAGGRRVELVVYEL